MRSEGADSSPARPAGGAPTPRSTTDPVVAGTRRRPMAASGDPIVPLALRLTSELCARFLIIAAALGVLIFLVIELRVVVIPVAISLLLAGLLAPMVSAGVHRAGMPRGLSTLLVMVGGIALLGVVLSFVVNAFIDGLPDLRDQLVRSYEITIKPLLAGPPLRLPLARLNNLPGELQGSLTANTQAITSGALSTAATVGEVASGIALGLFVLIFFLYDGERIWRFLLKGVPAAQRPRLDVAGQRAFASLVGYTRATVVVAVVDAIGIGIGLWALRVPLVVPLAALVFLGAFVPVVGAVLSGSVAVLVALVANGLVPAAIVLGVVIAVMQLESHVLQPLLMGRAVQLHPLAVVLAVAGGVVVSGITGALLAVPLVAVLAAGVRSLVSAEQVEPEAINPLDPDDAKSGPVDSARRRRLLRVASGAAGLSRRRRPPSDDD